MMKSLNKKGQGSFLSGDIPAIIMIVVSITFFIVSFSLALDNFEARKSSLDMEAAIVDAASTFLKENAKIRPEDLQRGSQFAELRMERLKQSYGVQVHVELVSLDPSAGDCTRPGDCTFGEIPPETAEVISKRFPIALRAGSTDLEVYPALVKVSVYK